MSAFLTTNPEEQGLTTVIGSVDIPAGNRTVIQVNVNGTWISCSVIRKGVYGYSYKDLKEDLVSHFGTTKIFY